jgi:hypothetical protein
MIIEVDRPRRSLLWADDERLDGPSKKPEVQAWAARLEREGMEVVTATTTGEAIKRFLHRWNPKEYVFTEDDAARSDAPGSIFDDVLLDLRMPLGSPPPLFREYLKEHPSPLHHSFSSAFVPDFLRETTGKNTRVGFLTGELGLGIYNPELELQVHAAHPQYLLTKAGDIIDWGELVRVMKSFEEEEPKDIGLGIVVLAARNAGKSVTVRDLNGMGRSIPRDYTRFHRTNDAGRGTFTFCKLTNVNYDDDQRYDINDLHHTSIYVPGLELIEPELVELDHQGLIILQKSKRANDHYSIWVVKKAAVPPLKTLFDRIGVDYRRNYPFHTLEDMLEQPMDWTTVTTSIEVAKKIIRRYRGPTLAVRMDISDYTLADRTAHRYGLSPEATAIIKSRQFIQGTLEKREQLIREFSPTDSQKKLIDDEGKLTDAAVRLMTNYELNHKIRSSFGPDDDYIRDNNFFRFDTRNPFEVQRLMEKIITMRQLYPVLRDLRREHERQTY